MKIVDFIKNGNLETLTEAGIDKLIELSARKLFELYGLNDDLFNPDNWALSELDDYESKINTTPCDFLNSLSQVSRRMSDDIHGPLLMKYYEVEEEAIKDHVRKGSLHQYSKKNRYSLDRTERCIPAILALKILIPLRRNSIQDLTQIVLASRLVQAIEQVELMIDVSMLWFSETFRNYEIDQINQRKSEFDNTPSNAYKKKLLSSLVINALLADETLSAKEIINRIETELDNKLEDAYKRGLLGDGDYKISPAVQSRWVKEVKADFDKAPD